MIRILITGANGQLGQSLLHLPNPSGEIHWIATDFPELDITDPEAVSKRLSFEKPDFLVNCAAYTAVDQAEKETYQARKINAFGPGILSRETKKMGIGFVHISTDYVFTGTGPLPYKEDDLTGPESAYGLSKLEGENAIRKEGHGIIIRTSWLYSEYGKNFLLTMLRLGAEKESLGVVMDQVGSPTYAGDLATSILSVVTKCVHKEVNLPNFEVFHFCNLGVASWYDFAWSIMKYARLGCHVRPIRTSEYPLPAERPAFSVMDTAKIRNTFGITIPNWQASMEKCIDNIRLK
jgi:dTDP-4-dehydrorhamnose reductase